MKSKFLLLEKLIFYTLILFLPTQLGIHFWPKWSFLNGIRIDYFSPTMYFTDILLICLLILWGLRLKQAKGMLVGLFIFTCAAIYNINFSLNQPLAIFKWLKFAEVAFFVYYLKDNLPKLSKNTLYTAFSVGMVAVFVIGVMQYITQQSSRIFYLLGERSFSSSTPGIALGSYPTLSSNKLMFSERLRPYATFSHPNSLAGYALVAFFILRTKSNKFSEQSKITALVLVFLSQSLAAIATFLYLIIIEKTFKNRKTAQLISVVIFGLLLNLVLLVAPGQSGKERAYLAKVATRIISQNPLNGVGLGNFIEAGVVEAKQIPESAALIKSNPNLPFQPVHNVYLLLASELGMIMSLAAAAFIVLILFKKYSAVPQPYLLALFAIALTGILDHYWLTLQQNQLLLGLVLGSIIGDKN